MTALVCLILATAAFTAIFIHLKKNAPKPNPSPAILTSANTNILTAQDAKTMSAQQFNGYTLDEIQNINVYDACNEAVVNINTQIVMTVGRSFEPLVRNGGSGSGSIIDKRGYVLTNTHVVSGVNKIYVSLSDGTQYEATIVGLDADSDLAVIKFKPPAGANLTTIAFGDSQELKVGQKVIAIGNPFGFDRTMTVGIVSALGRPIQNVNSNRIFRNMIQIDSVINPGNSGGPLLDTSGRMIGINSMIYENNGSSTGIGFAVPSTTAVRVVGDLLKYGKVRRGTIDISIVQLTGNIASHSKLDITRGVLVSQVVPGGAAEKAGLLGGTAPAYYGKTLFYIGGDVITKIDGIDISGLADYYSVLESKKDGDSVTLTVHRDKKDRVLTVKLVADNGNSKFYQ